MLLVTVALSRLAAAEVAAEPTVAEPAPSVPPAESKSGCLISNVDRGFGATALTLGATMLGLLLVGLLSRRRH